MPENHRRKPEVAHVHDYDSDIGGEAGPRIEAKRTSRALERAQRPGPKDAASDSGYSSHTSATLASNASSQAQRTVVPQQVGRRASVSHARPVLHQRTDSQPSARNAPSRSASISMKQCTNPNCGDPNCLSAKNTERRYTLPQQPPPYPQQTQYQYQQVPQSYAQPSVPLLATQPQARPRASSTSRPRPQSYHAGMANINGYPAQYQYAATPHGPPPSTSAYQNIYGYGQPYQPPPTTYYGTTPPTPTAGFPPLSPIHTSPTSPTYASRPTLGQHSFSARTPNMSYATTAYEQPKIQPAYTTTLARTPSARQNSSARHSTVAMPGAFPRAESSESDSDSESDSEYSEDDRYREKARDSRLMPPPALVPSRRPSLKRQSYTTSAVPSSRSSREPLRPDNRRAPRSDNDLEYASSDYVDSDRTARAVLDHRRYSSSRSSRRPSVSTTASSGRTKATTVSSGSGSGGKIVVEDRYGRRRSYLSKVEQEELARRLAHQQLEDDVEAYQDRVRGNKVPTLTAENIRKQETRASGSHVSANSHQSRKSSHSSRMSKEGIQITSGGTTLHIIGDAKVEMRQSEDGGPAQFVIASSSGKEKGYNDSKSSGSRLGRSRHGSDNRRKNTIHEEDGYETPL